MTQTYVKPEYPHSATTARIIKAAQTVHWELGPGYKEIFYQRALARELDALDLDFSREVEIDIHYKGLKLGHIRVDFVVEDVLVEIKAKSEMTPVDVSQTLSYLKASGYQVALLLNFGTPKLGIKRHIHSR
jgi:GxxExxY protein